jgi:hypothetical protein
MVRFHAYVHTEVSVPNSTEEGDNAYAHTEEGVEAEDLLIISVVTWMEGRDGSELP